MTIEILKISVSKLTAKDQVFANSMLAQFEKKGYLSDKQLKWVMILADWASKGYPVDHKENGQIGGTVATVDGTLGNFKTIIDLMLVARQWIKHPKIKLTTETGGMVALALMGDASKYPGSIAVTDGLPFSKSKFYGWITPEGEWTSHSQASAAVSEVVVNLAKDPTAAAVEHGHSTGKCCFCNRVIKDAEAKAVGYGPMCADAYGLPFGASGSQQVEAPVAVLVAVPPKKRGKRMAHEVEGWDDS